MIKAMLAIYLVLMSNYIAYRLGRHQGIWKAVEIIDKLLAQIEDQVKNR